MSPRVILVAFGLAALLFAAPVSAVDEAESGPPDWAYGMSHDLMSPFCPGRTLSACTSPQAAELRQWIIFQAAAGLTRPEIEAALFDRFGDQILSTPRAEGWGLSAYVIPVLAFVFGGGFVAFILRGLVRGAATTAPRTRTGPVSDRPLAAAGPSLDAELERLVDEELARR